MAKVVLSGQAAPTRQVGERAALHASRAGGSRGLFPWGWLAKKKINNAKESDTLFRCILQVPTLALDPALGSVQVRVGFRACEFAPTGLRIACGICELWPACEFANYLFANPGFKCSFWYELVL